MRSILHLSNIYIFISVLHRTLKKGNCFLSVHLCFSLKHLWILLILQTKFSGVPLKQCLYSKLQVLILDINSLLHLWDVYSCCFDCALIAVLKWAGHCKKINAMYQSGCCNYEIKIRWQLMDCCRVTVN